MASTRQPSVTAAAALEPSGLPLLLAAARRNLVPGLILQAFAVALVLLYYRWPEARPVFDRIAAAKVAGGYLFSALATALAAAVIPWLVEVWRGQVRRDLLWRDLAFVSLIWAWRGAEIDAFYRFQAWLFPGSGAAAVAGMVSVDMLMYSPLWAQPTMVAALRLRDAGYDTAAWRRAWSWPGFLRQTATVQAGGWVVWIPAVCVIYSLPSGLRFPLFTVMVCFWSLLLATLTGRERAAQAAG